MVGKPTFVYYYLPEDHDDADHPNVFLISKHLDDICLKDIRTKFPLPGMYHFRFKVKHASSFAWIDITSDDARLPFYQSKIITKVLRIHWGGEDEKDKHLASNDLDMQTTPFTVTGVRNYSNGSGSRTSGNQQTSDYIRQSNGGGGGTGRPSGNSPPRHQYDKSSTTHRCTSDDGYKATQNLTDQSVLHPQPLPPTSSSCPTQHQQSQLHAAAPSSSSFDTGPHSSKTNSLFLCHSSPPPSTTQTTDFSNDMLLFDTTAPNRHKSTIDTRYQPSGASSTVNGRNDELDQFFA